LRFDKWEIYDPRERETSADRKKSKLCLCVHVVKHNGRFVTTEQRT